MTTPDAVPFVKWLPVAEAPGYEVSDLGQVRSYFREGNYREKLCSSPRRRKLTPDKDGYLQVSLCLPDGGGTVMRKVHRLVLDAFIGPRPEGMEARHHDGRPGNNRLDNLSWATHEKNEADKNLHGTHTRGERNGGAKLTQREADGIRRRLFVGEPGCALAREHDVSHATISRIKKGLRYVAACGSDT